jgi:2-haloacid dehalogenase
MTVTTCVFDAYGTLFDVNAAARIAAEQPGAKSWASSWPALAANWRLKQLQYTWLRAVAQTHVDFWQVTQDGLDWAMDAAGLSDPILRETLLALYWELPAYAEVPLMLTTLREQGLKTATLSNGSPNMLDGAVSFSGIAKLLDAVMSVEEVGVFKPHRSVYDLVGKHFGTTPEQVLFVSANGWDAAAAAAYGFETVWVNRNGDPMDRLPGTPHHVLPDLSALPDLIRTL